LLCETPVLLSRIRPHILSSSSVPRSACNTPHTLARLLLRTVAGLFARSARNWARGLSITFGWVTTLDSLTSREECGSAFDHCEAPNSLFQHLDARRHLPLSSVLRLCHADRNAYQCSENPSQGGG